MTRDYPKETDGLLTTKNAQQMSSDNAKDGKETFRMVALFFLVLVGTLACYTYYEHHAPGWNAEKLIQKYKQEADQAMALLNTMSNSTRTKKKTTKSKKDIPVGCENTLLIFRHCEDLGGNVRYADGTSHCSYLGFQRSLYLATLFGDTSIEDVRWPPPSKLYGLWNKDGTNKRQYEMLHPLSEKVNVPIEMFNFSTAPQDVRGKVFELLSSGKFCNQVVALVWKHAFIRPLAATLGCDQERGCPDSFGDYDFDTVWELQYVYQPEKLRAHPEGESVLLHTGESLVDGWKVFGSVTTEGFDALQFKRDNYDSMEKGSNWMKHKGHG